jgi:hypothetical protein
VKFESFSITIRLVLIELQEFVRLACYVISRLVGHRI